MAHVEKIGKRYKAIYKNPAAKSGRSSKTFDRKIDAERFLATTVAAQLRNEWVDPRAGRVTLREYATTWLAVRPVRDSTRKRYDMDFHHLAPIGDMPLATLTPSALEAWQAGLLQTLAPGTVVNVRSTVGAILRAAVRDRIISASPMVGVRAPEVHKPLVYPPPLDYVLGMYAMMRPSLRASIMLGATCGPRIGEALGLTVDRLDFLRRSVRIDRQIREDNTLGPTKTKKSNRSIPLPETGARALAQHLADHPRDRADFVFSSRRGGPMMRSGYYLAWRDAEIRIWNDQPKRSLTTATREAFAKADESGQVKRYTFHDLRHFYASRLIADGSSVPEVQARLGHATAKETLDTYSHLWPDNEDRTRRIIDAAFASMEQDPDAQEEAQ